MDLSEREKVLKAMKKQMKKLNMGFREKELDSKTINILRHYGSVRIDLDTCETDYCLPTLDKLVAKLLAEREYLIRMIRKQERIISEDRKILHIRTSRCKYDHDTELDWKIYDEKVLETKLLKNIMRNKHIIETCLRDTYDSCVECGCKLTYEEYKSLYKINKFLEFDEEYYENNNNIDELLDFYEKNFRKKLWACGADDEKNWFWNWDTEREGWVWKIDIKTIW